MDDESADLDIPVFVATAVLMEAPISINDAYSSFRGKITLKKAGKAFRDSLKQVVARASTDWKLAHDCVYQHGGRAELRVTLYFTDLINKTWTPENKVKTKYKKKDASNYIKLIEDGVAKGSGLDDCNNLDINIRKRQDLENPRVEVMLATYVDDPEIYALLVEGDG